MTATLEDVLLNHVTTVIPKRATARYNGPGRLIVLNVNQAQAQKVSKIVLTNFGNVIVEPVNAALGRGYLFRFAK